MDVPSKQVGSLGHEPPQKDTPSEFHLEPENPTKLGVLGALLAPFSLDR